MDAIGPNVERLRLGRAWSKGELAARVDYATEAMIHQIEQGKRKPSYEQLKALARVFEVTVSDLMGDARPCGVTNNANGTHAIGYQHNEGAWLMTDEAKQVVRAIVQEVVDARCQQMETQLIQEFRTVLREAAREADGATDKGDRGGT